MGTGRAGQGRAAWQGHGSQREVVYRGPAYMQSQGDRQPLGGRGNNPGGLHVRQPSGLPMNHRYMPAGHSQRASPIRSFNL